MAERPDDGRRHELIDGTEIVTPAPAPRHQSAAFALARLLDDAKPPGLAVLVEVASPSTAMADRTIKWALYERAGVPAYWLFEPEVPRLMVLERDGAHLVERMTLTGDEQAELAAPFPLTVSPAKLG